MLVCQIRNESACFLIDSSDASTCEAFQQLVVLFSELIKHNVFSHDKYLCTLIARGEFVKNVVQKVEVLEGYASPEDIKDDYPVSVPLRLRLHMTMIPYIFLARYPELFILERLRHV